MKNLPFRTLFLVLPFVVACTYAQTTSGDANVVEETRKVSDFNALKVSHGIDVELTQGSSNAVIIIADANLQKKIIAKVEANELQLYVDGSIRNAKRLTAMVTVKNLNSIKTSSGSDVESKNNLNCNDLSIQCKSGSDIEIMASANSLKCTLSSGSDAELELKIKESAYFSAEHGSDIEAKIEANTIECIAKHGSDMELEGSVNSMQIEASGGSDISASGLVAKDCNLTVSGGSDAKVHATENLVIKASSASDVYYSGNPKYRDIHSSSGADVHGR